MPRKSCVTLSSSGRRRRQSGLDDLMSVPANPLVFVPSLLEKVGGKLAGL